MILWIRRAAGMLALIISFLTCPCMATKASPWAANSVIYSIYPSIFSSQGNLAGVTTQLGRLKNLGVTVVWIMPITPIGQPINEHPAIGSPYCVHDYFAVNPSYGSEADLHTLISTTHKLGLKIMLDEVLNHTAWDNALITQHPEYYVHSDGNPKNPASVQMAFNYNDVAQLNYANPELRTYMIHMLQFWISRYHVDGFRFDCADNPGGPRRMIPADFWQELGKQLRQSKPDILLLGEAEDPDLALKPFSLDYGWHIYDALKSASNNGSAAQVQDAWRYQVNDYPTDMLHMSIQDNWDSNRDVSTFSGPTGAMAVAVYNFTSSGVPWIYNGMEIGNAAGGINPHDPIKWDSGDSRFPQFYREISTLRRKNPALQQGTTTWLSNSTPTQVLTYTRTGGGSEFLIEINLSSSTAAGTVTVPNGSGWKEVLISGVRTHTSPPQISLQSKEFAIFKRSLPKP